MGRQERWLKPNKGEMVLIQQKNRFGIKQFSIILVGFLFFSSVCTAKEKDSVLIQGKTMGTTYHITMVTDRPVDALEKQIENRLKEINRSMSTYQKESEISRFNRMDAVNVRFEISKDFLQVMTVAEKIFKLTNGAWDCTVDPLVNLWGFGRKKVKRQVPPADLIRLALSTIGFRHIVVSQEGWLMKKNPDVTVDLASIAKGYGVDAVASLIGDSGYSDFLVEIGGEVYASGKRPDGKPWRVGINNPKPEAGFTEVYKVRDLSGKALATSGDYRNFFMREGKRYAHVLDPRTGQAVSNGVVSASVLADTCTLADGLATAVMVMGSEKGLELVNRLDGVECFIIVETIDGTFKDYASDNF